MHASCAASQDESIAGGQAEEEPRYVELAFKIHIAARDMPCPDLDVTVEVPPSPYAIPASELPPSPVRNGVRSSPATTSVTPCTAADRLSVSWPDTSTRSRLA